MKKFLIVLIVLLCLSGFAFAADSKAFAADKPLFAPGNISAQVGLGFGFLVGGLDIYGGAEYGIGSFKVADKIPLTYGAAARIGYWGWSNSYGSYKDSFYDIGIGALGTLHVSWKDLLPDVKWLSKVESYVGIGLGTYIYGWDYGSFGGTSSNFNFGFASLEGNNWYITPNIAINLEEGYYGYGAAGRLGVLFKL